ncbi:hypothetical protein FKF97_10175 [Clostridium perfringens]|nr:hypothetical protein [Clostridium perfringens]
MSKYRVLNCESVKDFASDFIGEVFDLVTICNKEYIEKNGLSEKCLGCLVLNTYDGELIFEPEEVEKVLSDNEKITVYYFGSIEDTLYKARTITVKTFKSWRKKRDKKSMDIAFYLKRNSQGFKWI